MRSPNGASKLYVGDLGENRKSDLTRLFSKYGEIATIYVDENKHFAFVEFTSSTDAQRALERTNNKTVNGSKLRVEYAKSDKPVRGEHRRAVSRERSPTVALYSHLQVTANRLPPMPVFRQSYHHHHPSSAVSNGLPLPSSTSRGRSLTPPSLKHNPRLAPMAHLRTQDFYYPPAPPPTHHHHHHAQQQHSSIYSDPSYYRNFTNDPYMMQRLPPTAFMSGNSSSRSYRTMYPSSDLDRSSSRPPHHHHQRRSRSRHRTSPSRRHRSSGEKKQKQKRSTLPSSSSSSSSSPSTPQQERERGPRTPPPVKSSTHRTKKRSRSGSDAVASTSEQKSSSNSSSEDEEEKQSNSRRKSVETDSNRKHSKRKDRE